MEQQRLPNVTIAIVLAIVSIVACCLPYGLGSIILAGIALFLITKDKKTLQLSDDSSIYSNAGLLRTAKVIAIIGLVIGIVLLILQVYMTITGLDLVFVEYLEELAKELEAKQ